MAATAVRRGDGGQSGQGGNGGNGGNGAEAMTGAAGRPPRTAGERAFETLARFVARHGRAVLAAVAVVTAAAAWQTTRISVDANIAGLLPQDSVTRRLIDEYGDRTAASELLVVGISHPDLLSLERIAQVGAVDRRLAQLPEVVGSVTPFNLQSFQRHRGRLVLAPLAAGGTAPANAVDLAEFDRRRSAAPDVLSVLLNPRDPGGEHDLLGSGTGRLRRLPRSGARHPGATRRRAVDGARRLASAL